jgi:hypothetical protein
MTGAGAQNNIVTPAVNDGVAASVGQGTQAAQGAQGGSEITGAPEKYEAFTMPEGFEIKGDVLSEFHDLAKGLGLSQEKAQGLAALAAKNAQTTLQATRDNWDKTREGWVESLQNDKDYGGENFVKTVESAKRVVRKFAAEPEGFIDFLDASGLGDHPGLIKFLANVDKAMGEDRSVDGRPKGGTPKTAAQTIYG